MSVLLIVIIVLTYVLFVSRSKRIGKFLFTTSMKLEQKLSKLHVETVLIDEVPISLYRNDEFSPTRPTLLLLHGFSADKTIWHRFAIQAKNDYNLIIPDMLGHGATPYSESQSYSTTKQTQMLIKLIDELKLSQYAVIGNSMGGMIAMQLLLNDNERISKAILLDPAGAKSDFAVEMHASDTNPFLLPDAGHFLGFYNRSMSKPPFAPPAVLYYIADVNYVKRYKELAHMFKDFFNLNDFFDTPMQIDQNKLSIVWGEEDQLLPLTDAELWFTLTGCKPVVYAGVGHMPMVETPKETYKDCHQFLSGNR